MRSAKDYLSVQQPSYVGECSTNVNTTNTVGYQSPPMMRYNHCPSIEPDMLHESPFHISSTSLSPSWQSDTRSASTSNLSLPPQYTPVSSVQEQGQHEKDSLYNTKTFSHSQTALVALPSPQPNSTRLLPVVIPQVSAGQGKPFIRAYAPALATFNVSEVEFIGFIDQLNLVTSPHPAMGLMNLTGQGLSMVPHLAHVGQGMALVAQAGTGIVSKKQTQGFIYESNASIFGPRGLLASICSSKEVKKVLGLAPDAKFLAPLDSQLPIAQQQSLKERRLTAFAGCASEIYETQLPLANPETLTNRISARQVQHDVKKMEKRVLKERGKAFERAQAGKEQSKWRGNWEERFAQQVKWIVVRQAEYPG